MNAWKEPCMRCLPWIFAALPWCFLLFMYWRYSLDYPRWDQWDFVPFLDKAFRGRVALSDFLAQHNEHRPFFPRSVMLFLARISGWDMRLETAASFFTATVVYLILAWRLWVHACRKNAAPWLVVPLAFLCFSLVQWRNWFLGWQLSLMMNVVYVVLCLLALTTAPVFRFGFGAALVCAVAATYSFANGILIWVIAIPVIYMLRPLNALRQIEWMAIWCITACIVTGFYFIDYQTPENHPSILGFLSYPLELPLYVLKYLGQPVCAWSGTGAALLGLTGILCWILLLYRRLLDPEANRANRQMAFALGLYAIGSAVVTGMGRVAVSGTDQAMSSRYATFACLLWFAILLLASRPVESGGPTRRLRTFLAFLLVMLTLSSSLYGAYRWTERYNVYSSIEERVRNGDDLAAIRWIYPPDPEVVIKRREILRHYGLAGFVQECTDGNAER